MSMATTAAAGTNVITTIAGTGTAGFSGDGRQATSAQLNYPFSVESSASGEVYIADEYNHRIRKITNGVITTIAGTGTAGFSGDGGQATSAQLYYPSGVALDGDDNLYIADWYNHRVRKITNGVITTIAGTGTAGFSGDGGKAISAQLNSPFGLDVSSAGYVYVATMGSHHVREISENGVITTIAGTGAAGFSGDGGQATSAQLYYPSGVALDGDGNLYIADWYNHRIRRVSDS